MTAIPALPDSERRTQATISASTGPVSVGFDLYGNSTDYGAWLEVWQDGVLLTAVTDWTLDSPSGALATLARPITDARVTFTIARTGTIDIVGADRPRRATQLVEGQGVSAHAFNQFATQQIARLREVWDTLKSRVLYGPPDETIAILPSAADRADKYLTFDSDGNPTATAAPVLGGGTLANDAVTDAYLRNSGACSVIGRAANSTGDPADISASANGQLLVRLSNALAWTTLSLILDGILGSTRGMILRREATAWAAYPLGAAGKFLKSDGTDALWADPTAGLPRGYIDGCAIANNASDATNDIDFSAGVCRDNANLIDITVAAVTKRLDADWAAGTGNGMRYSGAAITNTTYHLFTIVKADGTEDKFAYTGTDPTAVLPSGYIAYRRIASIIRSGGAILGFVQHGDEFVFKTRRQICDTAPAATTSVLRDALVPAGIRVGARISFNVYQNSVVIGQQIYAVMTSPDADDNAASATNFDLFCVATNDGASQGQQPSDSAMITVFTDTNAQVRTRQSSAQAAWKIAAVAIGWIDLRGKNS